MGSLSDLTFKLPWDSVWHLFPSIWSLIVTANGMERLLTFDSKRVLYFFLRGGDELWIVQRSKMIPAREKTKNEREEELASKGVDGCDSYCMGHR
jgi:hypothetical protein